jgi:hypothetical protein
MLKRLLILLTVVGVFMVLAPAAMAQNETSAGAGPATPCGVGTCFVERFFAAGTTAVYVKPAGGGIITVWAADCCAAGDQYLVTVKGPAPHKGILGFRGVAPLQAICPNTAPATGAVAVQVRDASKIRFKAVALPGGLPADAYLAASGVWARTAGAAACGGS